MRIKITLTGLRNKVFKRDHFYQLSGLIYSMLGNSNPEFSSWLHNNGYKNGNKSFKFFNFSRLLTKGRNHEYLGENKDLILFKDRKAYFYVSSPVKEFLNSLIDFLLAENTIKLGDHILEVENALAMPSRNLSKEVMFKSITPVVVSKSTVEYDTPFYIRAYQKPDEFDEYITKNAKEKWKIFSGEENGDILLTADKSYIKRKGRRTACKIELTSNQLLFGSIVPIKAEGDPSIISFLYDTGLGEKNSQGMGMVEVINKVY